MRRASVACLAILAIGVSVAVISPSARSSGFNLAANPGFESGTNGWEPGPGYTLSTIAGGHASPTAGLVVNAAGRGAGCSITDAPDWVRSTEAGTYTASVWVRNDRGGSTIALDVVESAAGERVGAARSERLLVTTWDRLTVRYTTTRPGSALDLRISTNRKPHKGDPCFLIDDATVTLDATTPAPAPSPTEEPEPSPEPEPTQEPSEPAPSPTSTSSSPTVTHTHEPSPTASTTSPTGAPGGGPDPIACTGYPEPRIFYETQSWWEPVPGIGGQGHVHLGVCWPHQQVVSGTVRLDLVAVLHGNRGTISRFKVQDDSSLDYNSPVWIPIDTTTGGDTTVIHTMHIDTTLQRDGLRQWRIYTYFQHANGNDQRPKAMYQVLVENHPGTADDVTSGYREYAGAGWYKEADGTDWGYQTALVKPSSHPAVGACVAGTWSPVVDTDASGTTEHMVTIDPRFHSGDQGWIVHASATGGYEGPVAIDTTRIADGWHRLVVQSARQDGAEENGGVFAMPFRVCNAM